MDLLNSPEFKTHVNDILKEHHVPGTSIAVYQDDKFASAGFGEASIERSVPCTSETLYDIASASKSITAAAVALLVEDDENYPEVKWDAPMSDLLPGDFVFPEESYTRAVTLEDILSHRSGMPRHDDSYLSPRALHPDNAKSVTRNLRHLPVAVPLRTKWIYCNMMYTVATYLVEKKTGMTFSDFVQQRIFGPLKMTSTNIQPSVAKEKGLGHRIATGHEWDEETEKYHSFPFFDDPAGIGAGSIVTSVDDYIQYVAALVNQEGPFTEGVYKGLTRPRIITDPEPKELAPKCSINHYAAGWETHWYRGTQIVMHDGSIYGSGTTHFFIPEIKFAGAIFGNAGNASDTSTILASELIDEALKVPKEERPDWNAWESRENKEGDEEKDENGEVIDPVLKMREQLCPGLEESLPQEKPLDIYVGKYFNAGYHVLEVQIKNRKLFIDASDRSFGLWFTLEHVCDGTKYLGHVRDFIDGTGGEPSKVIFEFDRGKPTRMAVELEAELKEQNGYIWFDRI